jgi:2,5-diamino-6-(ribosylamino)-4(3H)-pyrimidinone 5'-phosphate reductase
LPDKALRLYPPPTLEIYPPNIHTDLQIIPLSGGNSRTHPYTISNTVASIDGRISVGDKAYGIGSAVDRIAMRNLRARVDAVMVGAGTLRAEKLSLGLDTTPGGSQQPLAIIVAGSGEVPVRKNLIAHEGQDVLVISTEAKAGALNEELSGIASVLSVPAGRDKNPDLVRALQWLKQEYRVGRLLVEGGPRLNRALISCGLIDELFLTVAPKLLGGTPDDTRTIIEGSLPLPKDLRLISIHLASGEIFLRYALPESTR